jgi:hypothetical protein
MKVKKTLTVAIAAITIFSMFAGCSESDNIETDSVQSSGVETYTVQTNEVDAICVNEIQAVENQRRPAPLHIVANTDANVRDEIVRHISVSRTESNREEIDQRSEYLSQRISEIPVFYSVDRLEIDGYRLHSVNIYANSFVFAFLTLEELEQPDFNFSTATDVIWLTILREEWFDNSLTSDPLSPQQAIEQGWGYLTEDGMVYAPEHREVTAQLGNTVLRVMTSGSAPRDYEFLRDLALQVTETSERVDVAQEIDRIRQSES